MSELVERVARAIYEEGKPPHEPPWPGRHPSAFRSAARAAIAEMREPSDCMVRVGVDFALSTTVGSDSPWPVYIADKHRAMIDAALRD